MMTTEPIIEEFEQAYRAKFSDHTLASYVCSITAMLAFTGKPFDHMTRPDIRRWLDDLSDQGMQPTTLGNRLFGVKKFYEYCYEEGLITRDPAASIPPPAIPDRVPRYLTLDQLTQLRELIKNKREERAVLEVLYATGMRVRELASMRLKDIHWQERIMYVRSGKDKQERLVLFTRLCEETLKDYLSQRTDDQPYLFLNKQRNAAISIRTIESRFEKYRGLLGFYFTPHTIRHTFAAHLAQKGMNFGTIQDLLGHNDPRQTQLYARLYNHARKMMYDSWM